MSHLDRCHSSASASRISVSLRDSERSLVRKRFLASCCVMVEPPPRSASEKRARESARRSTPLCWKKRRSSEATTACHSELGMSSIFRSLSPPAPPPVPTMRATTVPCRSKMVVPPCDWGRAGKGGRGR